MSEQPPFPQSKKIDPEIPRWVPGKGMDTGYDIVNGQEKTPLVEQKTVFAIIRPDMALFEGLADYGKGDMRKFFENASGKHIRLRIDIISEATENEYEEWSFENPILEVTSWEKVKDKVKKSDRWDSPPEQLDLIP